eukprot:scaffold43322_cov37-Phaeocystis_antarctica.AAC.2
MEMRSRMRFRHPRCENISYIPTGNTGDTRPEALVCRAAVGRNSLGQRPGAGRLCDCSRSLGRGLDGCEPGDLCLDSRMLEELGVGLHTAECRRTRLDGLPAWQWGGGPGGGPHGLGPEGLTLARV